MGRRSGRFGGSGRDRRSAARRNRGADRGARGTACGGSRSAIAARSVGDGGNAQNGARRAAALTCCPGHVWSGNSAISAGVTSSIGLVNTASILYTCPTRSSGTRLRCLGSPCQAGRTAGGIGKVELHAPSLMPERQGQGDRECRAAERSHQRGSPQRFPRRKSRELDLYEIEIIGDAV